MFNTADLAEQLFNPLEIPLFTHIDVGDLMIGNGKGSACRDKDIPAQVHLDSQQASLARMRLGCIGSLAEMPYSERRMMRQQSRKKCKQRAADPIRLLQVFLYCPVRPFLLQDIVRWGR